MTDRTGTTVLLMMDGATPQHIETIKSKFPVVATLERDGAILFDMAFPSSDPRIQWEFSERSGELLRFEFPELYEVVYDIFADLEPAFEYLEESDRIALRAWCPMCYHNETVGWMDGDVDDRLTSLFKVVEGYGIEVAVDVIYR